MMKKYVWSLFVSAMFLFPAIAAKAQATAAGSEEEPSVNMKTGDVACFAGKDSFNLHYAIVPMVVRKEASLYIRLSRPVAIMNILTSPDGAVMRRWSNEGDNVQCYTDVPYSLFTQGATGAGYTWKITTAAGKELARIAFTAQEAAIK